MFLPRCSNARSPKHPHEHCIVTSKWPPIVIWQCVQPFRYDYDIRILIEMCILIQYNETARVRLPLHYTVRVVFRRVGCQRELWKTVKKKKVAYLGHVLRHDRYRLLQLIMMGKVAGKRRIGRKRKSWLRNIREWTGIASAAQLFSLAREKEKYQKLTANLH
ncbi:jg18921 [Pararge aegeria aegeria]|uniref:Jg18921 protein n=1 Tax=Pararge aegeria aegeria TaxID=348720 RepID=A0A8S4SHG3_9NEOP|nr:jg18921 [Pararge aegeria aegeria]